MVGYLELLLQRQLQVRSRHRRREKLLDEFWSRNWRVIQRNSHHGTESFVLNGLVIVDTDSFYSFLMHITPDQLCLSFF